MRSAKYGRRIPHLLLVTSIALTGLLGAVGVGVATSAPAGAWVWSSDVTLNGSIECPAYGGPSDVPTWVWVQGNTGDQGWASLGGGYSRPYSFNMTHVPSGSAEQVQVRVGCAVTGEHIASFGVQRPLAGSYATRNITF